MFNQENLFIEIASLIIQSLVVVGLFTAIRQLSLNRKQLHLETIRYCVTKFQELQVNNQSDISVLEKYLDLCNEELFYIKNGYLPKAVAYDWLDGLLDFMPIWYNDEVVNEKHISNSKLIELQPFIRQYYPRMYNTFKFRSNFTWNLAYSANRMDEAVFLERRAIIKAIMKNLTSYKEY